MVFYNEREFYRTRNCLIITTKLYYYNNLNVKKQRS